MRALSRAIERFCAKNRRFGIPQMMRYIVIISAAVYLLDMLDLSGTFISYMYFDPDRIIRGQVWRLISWVFIPQMGYLLYFALSLYLYYYIGNTLEREWGTAKFSFYYFSGIIINIIYGFLMWYFAKMPFMLTASYLNLSMYFAYAVLFPDNQFMIMFIIPVKVKWLALVNAFYFAYSIYVGLYYRMYSSAFLPLVAILNFFIICGGDLLELLRPVKARASAQSINFQRAARQAQRQRTEDPLRHKCSVCGKTNLDHPSLDFRYCSRCEGYHCFCIEHINNHVHFR